MCVLRRGEDTRRVLLVGGRTLELKFFTLKMGGLTGPAFVFSHYYEKKDHRSIRLVRGLG